MPKLGVFFCLCAASAACAQTVANRPATLKCEEWHPRLGQLADRTHRIDFAAKTCNGQSCAISDGEFKWQDQNGQVEVTINRASGEGRLIYRGELTANFKNCKLDSA